MHVHIYVLLNVDVIELKCAIKLITKAKRMFQPPEHFKIK